MSCLYRHTGQALAKERRTAVLMLCPVYLGVGAAQPLVLSLNEKDLLAALRTVNLVELFYSIPSDSSNSLQEVAVETLLLLIHDGRNDDFLGRTCTGESLSVLLAVHCVYAEQLQSKGRSVCSQSKFGTAGLALVSMHVMHALLAWRSVVLTAEAKPICWVRCMPCCGDTIIFTSAAHLWESRKFAEDGLAKRLEGCWTQLSHKLSLKLTAPLLSMLSAESRGFTTKYFKSMQMAKKNLRRDSPPVLSSAQRVCLHTTLTSENVSERLANFCTGFARCVDPDVPALPFTGQVYNS